MVLEAGYPSTTGFRKVTKVTVLVKKKAGMSDADFITHYNHHHAAMAAPVLLRHGVVTYSLVSSPTNRSCLLVGKEEGQEGRGEDGEEGEGMKC